MSEAFLFYSMIILFGTIYVGLVFMPQKQMATKTDYFLAGRGLGFFKATCTLIATQLGAGLLLGTSQEAYKIGLYGLLFTLGISLGLVLLGCGIAGRLRALNIVTTTQIFETKYNSPFLRKIASLLVTFTLCGILVGNMVASKTLVNSLGFSSELFYLIFWLFIIAYTMVGGLRAVVLTDLFQVLFIVVTFTFIIGYSLWSFPPTLSLEALRGAQQHFSGQVPDMHTLVIMLLMPALFALFEQDLAQIFFASKTKNVATMAAIATTVFMLTFGLIPIYLGTQAQLMGIAVASNQSPLFALIKTLSNSLVLVMVACGILAAIASTADALLCAIGANITQDFSLSFLGLSPLVESKSTIFTMGMVVLGLSYVIPSNVISILIRSYEIPVNCLLVPILAAYFFDDAVTRYAGIGGLLGGAFGLVFFNFIFPVGLPSLYTLGLSLIAYVVGHFVQKRVKAA